jgi:hypothetical protein
MRYLAASLVVLMLTGCAGTQTVWRFQMDMMYATPQDKPAAEPIAPGKGS